MPTTPQAAARATTLASALQEKARLYSGPPTYSLLPTPYPLPPTPYLRLTIYE